MPRKAAQALVIVDADDNYYVLPREVIAMAKAAPETRSAIEEHLGDCVSVPLADGFSFAGSLTLPPDAEWAYYTEEPSWPNATSP
ncbi:hypothetical protein AB0K09_07305 [Streptomyces sp. NPDC049577]|uniref:hypothetical protein n=1 Tax=Streptomyces sp. NPDC049577 TaxID=3155153 RepID=UPI0034407685